MGLPALVNKLLNSPDHRDNFGTDRVPFQCSRVPAGQAQGVRPFNHQAPGYGHDYREGSANRTPAGSSYYGWQPSGGFSVPRRAWLAEAPCPHHWRAASAKAWSPPPAWDPGVVIYTAALRLNRASAG